jgi:cation-transporting P-type ATPase A/B
MTKRSHDETANLALALGSGADVAICAADMILLRDDLQTVPDAIVRLVRS